MSDSNVTVEEIELDIDEARSFVDLGDALSRLEKNPDFKKLILDGFLRDEAVRLVEAKALPNLQDEKFQTAILKAIDAIGSFREYLRKTRYQAEAARESIRESEAALEEMLESGDEAA